MSRTPHGHLDLHADALDRLSAWSAPDDGQEQLRRRYVEHLRARPDATSRECRPDHLTASTLVLSPDRARVLLTLHAKAGRWFQLGGHCEPEDPSLAGAARREALEESGLSPDQLDLDDVPLLLDAHAVPFCGPTREVTHLDVMYAATAPDDAAHAVSAESLDVAWWPVDALPDPELEPFVARALTRLSPR